VQLNRDYADLARYMRTLPPDAGVALYSIGEMAYVSQHPVVDTGGITRPGIIPYIEDPTDDRRFAWMRSQGARYIIIDHPPTPDATLLWGREIPVTGWYFNPRAYDAKEKLQLWTLPPAR
jgi:hypothetical protein